MIPDYESWSLEDLDAELLRLSQQADEVRAQRRAVAAVRSVKATQADMETRLSAMSDAEQAALAQVVGVDIARIKQVVRNG